MSHEKLRSVVENELEKIRPYLAIDNGGVEFVRFEEDERTLVLRLTGNCAVCPLSMMTLRAGIERFILSALPEVRRIEKAT